MKLENDSGQDRVEDFGAESPDVANEIVGPAQDRLVTLPAGASLEDIAVEGRDLVITLADGSRMVIPDGAVFVPQIVVDGVAVPPQTVAQLLTGNEPEPAAGAPQSSGGNFAGDEGAIQDAFDIGDLLPFTQLSFPENREEEIIPAVQDEEPEVVIETPDNPVGVQNAIATVDEDGLPVRGSGEGQEPEGTRSETDSEITSGTIVFSAPDGLSAILINGVELTGTGQSFTSPLGTLTITGVNLETGEVDFDYVLEDNALGEDADGFFAVTVIDADGDQAVATLSILIVDDSPIAADDIGIVPAGSHAPITGDVLVNDEPGADDYAIDGAVQGFSNTGGSAAPGETLQGEFGTLTLNADGTYTYVRDLNTPGGVEESFEYSIVDQDGSTSSATLTIEIEDSPDAVTEVPRVGEGTVVDEGALAPRGDEPVGSGEIADGDPDNNSDPTENTGATISFNSPDGVESVTLNGVAIDPGALPQTIINDGTGTLIVTGYTYDPVTGDGTITYEYTLADNTSGDDTSVSVDIVVTDLDGDVAADTLVINIIDDEPSAADDAEGQVAENAPVTIDVLANDTTGADDVDPGTVALVDGTLSGAGTLVNNGDGTFTYTPGPGEEGTVTFDYTITDGDGDVSSATATLELVPDSIPEIFAEGNDVADEAGLAARGDEPAGSDEASNSEFANGEIFIDTGNDTVGSLVINGVDVTNGGTVTTSKGVLTVTLTSGTYEYTYELTDNTLTDPDSDSFSLTVTDSDGDTASTTIVIAIVDDVPTAEDDSGALGAGQYGPVGGDVLANDTQGADGASVTSYSGAGGSSDAGETLQGQYGVLTIAADGTYSYTRDPGTPGGVSDTFNYTITDGDGDTSNADLVITIANSTTTLDLPTTGEAGTEVDEAGLAGPPAGSDAASDSETTAGTFTFTAPDSPATVTIDGVTVTTVGQTFTGTYGTLEITGINAGSISYSYTLDTNTSGDSTSDSFDVRVTDVDGDFSEDTLDIAIIDDVPTANADVDSVTEDGPTIASGNVITGVDIAIPDANTSDGVADVQGADGATVTGVVAGTVTGPVSGDVGASVAGTYGSISILADGSYIYALNNADPLVQGLDETESLTETFTYTITDGDGDPATTTVTITINGADDPVVITGLDGTGAEEVLDEDDLADGSSPDAGALVQTGSFDVTSQDGLATLTVGGVTVFDANAATVYPVTIDDPVYGLLTITGVSTTTDANGDVVAATVSYSYTLQDNSLLHNLSGEDNFVDSFTVEATDTDGSTDTSSLDIQIVDDIAAATDNSNTVDEGSTVNGNVLTDDDGAGTDSSGADGYGADGAVIEIFSVNDNTTQSTVDGSGNLVITTSLGTLTVDATTGAYSYVSSANSTNTDVADVFTYTIVDGDGDMATATLTIDVTNAPGEVSDNNVIVNEAGLPIGSDPTSDSEIDADGQISVVGATGTLVYNLLSPADGTYGTLVLNSATGEYTYTLDTPFDTSPDADDGTNVVNGAESFNYEVRDTNGNLIGTGSIDVSIIDDIPTANADTNSVGEGDSVSGNVLVADGLGSVSDEFGADGAEAAGGVVGVRAAGGDTTTDASGSVGVTINGLYGTLTLNADGSYTYNSTADAITGDEQDVFVYTIEDGDGDLSTTTLTVDVANVTLAPDNNTETVNEAALDLVQDGDDLAAGTVTGSDPTSTAETVSGQLAVTGAVSYVLDSASDTYGTLTLNPDGSYTYTLTAPFDTSPDADNGTNTEAGAESYGYTATDANGNTVTGTITIDIVDDIPTANDDGEIASVDDNASAENVGTVATLTGNDSYGADGEGSPAVTIATGSLGGTVTIDGGGNLLYTSATNITSPFADQVETFTYTITDGDGDTTTATFEIRLTDEGPAINADAATFTVDEEGLAGGIAGNGDDGGDVAGEVTVQTGTLAGIDFGTDGAGDVVLTAVTDTGLVTLAGNAVESVWDGLTHTLTGQDAVTGDDVFTLVITDVATGAYTFTLLAPVSHPTADTEDDQSFTVGVVVSDAEGETANGTISVTIDDDSPIATDDTNALTEDTASVSGNVVTDPTADAFGADGAGDPAVTAVTGFGGAAGTVNGSTTGEFGSLALNDDGSYIYNLNTALVQGLDDGESETDTFTYTIVDADGDTSEATLTITINGANDAPVAVADTNWTVEDAAAAITGNVLQDVDHSGAPDAAPRADNADTDVDIEPLTVTTTGAINGTYGVLTLNSDGSYSYDLYTEAQNPTAYAAVQALNEGDAPLSDVFNYTTSDGDLSDSSTLTIDIFGANDAPVVGTASVNTSDEGLTNGLADTAGTVDTTNSNIANGTVSITDVDDTAFTVTLSVPTETIAVADGSVSGATIAWSLSGDGKTLTGTINGGADTAITVVIDDTGAFTVTQSLPIFHADDTQEDHTSFTVDVNVNDGTVTTTQTDAITVTLEDDSPVAVVAADLTTTNGAGNSGTAFLDSDFNVDDNFGGDGGKVIFTAATITALEGQGLTSGLAALSYSISADGTVLTAVKSGSSDTVFTITLDPDTSPDQYVLDLILPLDSITTVDFNDGNYDFVGGNGAWAGFNQPADPTSLDLLLTPLVGGVETSTVNTSDIAGGVGSGNSLGSDGGQPETIRVDFVNNLGGDPGGPGGYSVPANQDHTFDNNAPTNGASALFTSSSGTEVNIAAFDDTDNDADVGDGTLDEITAINIDYNNAQSGLITDPGNDTPFNVIVGGSTFTVTFNNDGTVNVDGVKGSSGAQATGTRIAVFTDQQGLSGGETIAGYTTLEFTWASGDTIKVGDFGATTQSNEPVLFSVPISVTDNDGDTVSSDDLDITLNPATTTTATTSSSSATTAAYGTSQVPLDGLMAGSNDNGATGPSGGDGVSEMGSLLLLQQGSRSDMRISEVALVAAISGAVLVDQVLANDAGVSVNHAGSVAYDLVAFDTADGGLAPETIDYNGDVSKFDLIQTVDGISGGDAPWNSLAGESALESSPEMVLGLQAQPDQIELFQSQTDGIDAFDQSAFFNDAAVHVDQAMEALLAIEPGTDAVSDMSGVGPMIDGLAENANAIFAEITVEAAFDHVIDGLTGASEGADYLTVETGTPNFGLLDQTIDNSVHSIEPLALMDTHMDDAAASAVTA